jgi:hypothetical protein
MGIAQPTGIEVAEVLYDFGIIQESKGKVKHDIKFTNDNEIPLIINNIETSCGCTVPLWVADSIAPGESTTIQVTYNPEGRPGKFIKSVLIKASTREKSFNRYVNIKGFVIGKDEESKFNLEQPSPNEKVLYDISIKPFTDTSIFIDSLPLSTEFQSFINDITYVIDQDNFANLALEFNISYLGKFSSDTFSIPQFKQHYKNNDSYFNTFDLGFAKTMNALHAELSSGRSVKIFIESSASRVPPKDGSLPMALAVKKSEEVKEVITQHLLNRGIPKEKIEFAEYAVAIQGPPYDRSKYSIYEYNKFQYVKITPIRGNQMAAFQHLLKLKKLIIHEIERRQYASYQVGFWTHITKNPFKKYLLKIASSNYNNEFLEASKITPINESFTEGDLPIEDSLETFLNVLNDNTVSFHEGPFHKKQFYENEGNYSKFASGVRREALAYGNVNLLISACISTNGKTKRATRIEAVKIAYNIKEKLKKQLLKEGLSEQQINFYPYQVWLLDSIGELPAHRKEMYNKMRITRMYQEEKAVATFIAKQKTDTLSQMALDLIKENETMWKENEADTFPDQSFLIYKKEFEKNEIPIDTSSTHFRVVMAEVVERYRSGSRLQLLIESSVSRKPTGETYDNYFLVREKERITRNLIEDFLIRKGISKDQIRFTTPIHLVQGPIYNTKFYKEDEYDKFQYMKIIPLYETGYDVSTARLSPYKIHFGYNLTKLNAKTHIFQNFVDRIARVIQKQGYIRLIIESSSSKVPTITEKTNDILAFHRAEEARNNILSEIRARGIDPRRVVITEERILVQGPVYNPETDSKTYERFQYIKILPEVLLKK